MSLKLYQFNNSSLTNSNSDKLSSYASKSKHLKKFNIITKIANSKEGVIEKLLESKKKLKIDKFYGVLFHDEKELLSKSPKGFVKFVKSLKDNNITNKVGVSVYTLKSLNSIIKKFNLDLIQVPANIFDKRFCIIR